MVLKPAQKIEAAFGTEPHVDEDAVELVELEAADRSRDRSRGVHGMATPPQRRSYGATQRLLIVDKENCRHVLSECALSKPGTPDPSSAIMLSSDSYVRINGASKSNHTNRHWTDVAWSGSRLDPARREPRSRGTTADPARAHDLGIGAAHHHVGGRAARASRWNSA